MATVNLLRETELAMLHHGFLMRNVRCIRNAEGYIPIADFVTMASLFDYDNGYGEVCVDPTLTIIGAFWWMTRVTYDGAEGWEFHKKPRKPGLPAAEVKLQNTRSLNAGTFESIVEKCGGFFEEDLTRGRRG